MRLRGENARHAWLDTVTDVLDRGREVIIACADGQTRKTLEITGHEVIVDMELPVIDWSNRKPNFRFMAGEAAWNLSGSDKLSEIEPFNKHIAKFSDDGVKFNGAYGPKIVSQLEYVIDALVKERTSRRAVLTIWRENPTPSRDIPCTVSAQFLIRENFLDLVVTMRSSDVWLGLTYDIFTFSMLAGVIFLKLRDRGVELDGLGDLHNYAGSRHLYEQDITKIQESRFIKDPGSPLVHYNHFTPIVFNDAQMLHDHLWAVARGERKNLKDLFMSDLPYLKEEV